MLSREEVAALMGHASAETAGNHYGRRTVGRSSVVPGHNVVIPRAAPTEVARVRPAKDAEERERPSLEPGFVR